MGIWLLPILLGLIALGMPISFSLGVTSLIGFILLDKVSFLSTIPQIMFAGLNSFPILAMPFFMLAGEIMNRARITDRLVQMSDALVGYLRGGMGHVNVMASIFFAGISGSAVADTSALGPLEITAMVDSGYDRSYSAAITAASSIIGPIIPPSIIMVIYGALMNVSIAGMFAAGLIPGILMGAALMLLNYFISTRRRYPKRERLPTIREIGSAIRDGAVAMVLPLIILGGILGGVFTPTEAAAVAVAYALVVGFVVYRNLTLKDLFGAIQSAVRTSGIVLIIIAMGSVLAWLFAIDRVPEALANLFMSVGGNNYVLMLLIINVLLLIVGTFMDITAALIILAPVLAPLATRLGVNPLHFGVIMCVNLNIGLITPPLGACLFVASSISKVRFEEVVREIWPFILAEVGVLMLITYIPALTLTVPRLLGLVTQ